MPIGMITDVSALLLGGLLGGVLGKRMPQGLKTALNNIFGICAIAIGITLIVKLHSLSVVVLSAVLGTILGEALHLEERIDRGVRRLAPKLLRGGIFDDAYINTFCAVGVIFCCSGTGWYGILNEGLTADSSILVTKAILDFFTAAIFAAVLGRLVSFLAAPQLLIYLVLFSVSKLVLPLVNAQMLADFSAVGGIVELATGLRIAGIKRDTKVINIIPAMILVFFVSALWNRFL